MLLVALLLFDPNAVALIGLETASTALNTYLSDLSLPMKSTEEVIEGIQQLVTYALLSGGDNTFGRVPNPYEVTDIVNIYYLVHLYTY